ncbi:hypothetical protein SLNWT_6867 [Streptomyces albus]|uniref:Uncharacterized protein n=1 Tax=Streptomyces albus (strain ATCC 21838 / DSM 41398 / FERM P-419 / JCM 4703 / NBRC 107858) TaxID=1081613 RepID=A0A0B5EWR3_STRA4|nr:hypothetical protein SLNWT_6867 [Streptomyces albus]AOU81547.1 hypothetical protein SLNHY_6856 [Streptomyces albus]
MEARVGKRFLDRAEDGGRDGGEPKGRTRCRVAADCCICARG